MMAGLKLGLSPKIFPTVGGPKIEFWRGLGGGGGGEAASGVIDGGT
jgi:hypothetical protein